MKTQRKQRLSRSGNAAIVRLFLRSFRNIEYGSFSLTTPAGNTFHYRGRFSGPSSSMQIHHWRVVDRIIAHGDIGLGESYIDREWDSDNISSLIHFFLLNINALEVHFFHGNIFNKIKFLWSHFKNRNSKKGSRRNIRAHYDVGNDFYRLWLDETMTYSSALFADDNNVNLAMAQREKYARILRKLDKKRSTILEIGCGWGGFAEEAAKKEHYVTGITISDEQLRYAKERLAHYRNADIVLRDYRDVQGLYDYIVSIEMIEAVGEEHWPNYFAMIQKSLSRDGKAVIQAITIQDNDFANYRKRSDFIRQYAFPGGMLPSLRRIQEEAHKAGLKVKEIFSFGLDYARTLDYWLQKIDENKDAIQKMGYTEEFIRSWRFYISMSCGSFLSGRTDVVQLELAHDASWPGIF